MAQIVQESREHAPDFGEQRFVLKGVIGEPALQQTNIPQEHPSQVLKITAMPKPVVLDQDGYSKTTHVGIELFLQPVYGFTVTMVYHGKRIILNSESARQGAIPQLGITAAPGSADIKALIEVSRLPEYILAESHVGASANLPHGWAGVESRAKVIRIVTP